MENRGKIRVGRRAWVVGAAENRQLRPAFDQGAHVLNAGLKIVLRFGGDDIVRYSQRAAGRDILRKHRPEKNHAKRRDRMQEHPDQLGGAVARQNTGRRHVLVPGQGFSQVQTIGIRIVLERIRRSRHQSGRQIAGKDVGVAAVIQNAGRVCPRQPRKSVNLAAVGTLAHGIS